MHLARAAQCWMENMHWRLHMLRSLVAPEGAQSNSFVDADESGVRRVCVLHCNREFREPIVELSFPVAFLLALVVMLHGSNSS